MTNLPPWPTPADLPLTVQPLYAPSTLYWRAVAEAAIARLEAARPHMRHLYGCPLKPGSPPFVDAVCTCGLAELLADLLPKEEAT